MVDKTFEILLEGVLERGFRLFLFFSENLFPFSLSSDKLLGGDTFARGISEKWGGGFVPLESALDDNISTTNLKLRM